MIRVVLLLLFVLSGGAGLVYEVAWTRRLVLVLGNSTHAVALILAAFMLGLALGSWVFGRRADRIRRPVLVYGLLEAGVGIYAIVFPRLLGSVTDLYVSLGPATGASYAVKFGLAFLLLLVPAFLMGGTLPVIVRWAVDRLEVVGGRVGAFYGANTFGAVVGSFLAGYVLIETFGVLTSTYLAAGVNLAVAALAVILDLTVPRTRVEAAAPPASGDVADHPVSDGMIRWTAGVFAVGGFCALALEVLWTRMLVFFLQGFTWAFCAMLTTFLLGLALGAAVLGRVANRVRDPVRFLGLLMVGIAVASGGAFVLLGHMYGVWQSIFRTVVGEWGVPYRYGLFFGSFLVMIVPTFLMGGVFPTVSRIVTRRLDEVGQSVGWVYALNTIGAVGGSLAAGLLLVPLVGMQWATVIVIGIEAAAGALLLLRHAAGRGGLAWSAVTASAVALVVLIVVAEPSRPFIERSHVFQGRLGRSRKLVEYAEGAICAVSVVEDEITGYRTLYTDEFAAAATGDSYRYMRMLGHLPLMLSPERKDVLVIAFGTGTTAGSVSVHEGVHRVDVVEISQEVLDVAHRFEDVNKGVLTRAPPPRVVPHVMDGRNFVLTTDRRYDVVTLEPLMPYTPAAVNLYTKEFYELCAKVLKPGGVMCQWIPIHAMTVESYRMLARSFQDVFPDSSVWFFETTSAIIGRTEGGPIDYRRLAERAREAGVAADLREVGLEDPDAILSCFVTGGKDLATFLDGIEPMTDEHPMMEFRPEPMWLRSNQFVINLEQFRLLRRPLGDRLDLSGLAAGERATTRAELAVRYEQGQDFLAARRDEQLWKFRRDPRFLASAVANYDNARRRSPELADPILDRYRANAYHDYLVLEARTLLAGGDRAGAIAALERAIRLDPPKKPHQSWFELGRIHLESGEVARAEAAFRTAVELFPGEPAYREALASIRSRRKPVTEEDVATARALLASVEEGRGGQETVDALRNLVRRRARMTARLEPELRVLERRVLDADGAPAAQRDRALRLLLLLGPGWIQETLATVVADARQGLKIRGLATEAAVRRPGHAHLFVRLREGPEETRLVVLRALSRQAPDDAIPALVAVLDDESREVRQLALLALFQRTGKQFDYDPDAAAEVRAKAVERWRAWLASRIPEGDR